MLCNASLICQRPQVSDVNIVYILTRSAPCDDKCHSEHQNHQITVQKHHALSLRATWSNVTRKVAQNTRPSFTHMWEGVGIPDYIWVWGEHRDSRWYETLGNRQNWTTFKCTCTCISRLWLCHEWVAEPPVCPTYICKQIARQTEQIL